MIESDMLKAQIKISQLVEAAERGGQVFLKRNGVSVAQIVPLRKHNFPFGFMKDHAGGIPDSLLFDSGEENFENFSTP